MLTVDSANLAGRGSIDTACGPSPLRSHDKNPPMSPSASASHASPNSERYVHHNASARAYDLTVFGDEPCTRRYSRNSSAGPTTPRSGPSTVHVVTPPGSTKIG